MLDFIDLAHLADEYAGKLSGEQKKLLVLGSIGLTLVYGVLKFPNFSHGALVTLGAYFTCALMSLLPQGAALRPFSFGWEFLVALVVSMPLVGAVALAVDRVMYRPLRLRGASLVLLARISEALPARSAYLRWMLVAILLAVIVLYRPQGLIKADKVVRRTRARRGPAARRRRPTDDTGPS